MLLSVTYRIVGKLGEFDESPMICQTKTIQISTYNYNLLAESIHLLNVFFAKCSKQVNLPNFIPAKLSRYTIFSQLCYENVRISYIYTYSIAINLVLKESGWGLISKRYFY